MRTFQEFLLEAKHSKKKVGSSLDRAKAFKAREKSKVLAQRKSFTSKVTKPVKKKVSTNKPSLLGKVVKHQQDKVVKSVGKKIKSSVKSKLSNLTK